MTCSGSKRFSQVLAHSVFAGCIAAGSLCASPDAMAWGPKSQGLIVSSAARVLSQEKNIPLTRLQADIDRGVQIESAELAKLIPVASANPLAAIQAEMYLLQSVKGDRVDPYFAYRLGVLGRLVADATGPLANARASVRNAYYADTDQNVTRITLKTNPRRTVDPATYFPEVERLANQQSDLIIKDYEAGLGFAGIAKASMQSDVNRSIDAVADVWFTVLSGSVVVANVSESQVRNFAVSALEFYVNRGNTSEADATYNKLESMGMQTLELRERIGDMYFAAGSFDRAMEEYTEILEQDPGKKNVAQKIAAHYVTVGDKAMELNRLEAAYEAYAKAAETDKLNGPAQVKVVEAGRAIEERDARMKVAEDALTAGDALQTEAEQESRRNNFAKAMELLTLADASYGSVTDEFPDLNREALSARNTVASRLQEIRTSLRDGSGNLSGSGSTMLAKKLATDAAKSTAGDALKALIAAQYDAQVAELGNEALQKISGVTP